MIDSLVEKLYDLGYNIGYNLMYNRVTTTTEHYSIKTASYFEVGGLPEKSFVERLGMSDVRVLTIHINSDAFRHSILRVRTTLRAIFAKALMSYTDFITGDFNLFANRQFKTDKGGTYIGGIVVEVLEDVYSCCHEWTFGLAEQNYI